MGAAYTDYAGLAAGAVALAALIPYVLSILSGKTRPNRASWIIWTIAALITALTYRAAGATTTFWIAAAYTVNASVVAGLAFKYGEGRTERFDWLCLVLALVSLIPWLLFDSPATALYLDIFVDVLAVLPTIRKAYWHPASEHRPSWLIAFAATAINLAALDTWAPEVSLYAIYCFLSIGAITGTLYMRRRFHDSGVSAVRPGAA